MPPRIVERLDQASSLIQDSDPSKPGSVSGSGAGDQQQQQQLSGPNIKCVLVGDGSIGKTSLVVSYTINGYPTEYMPTAFDNYRVVVQVDNEPVTLQLCDTAGQDDFDTLRPLCYRDPATDVFLLCFSVVSPTSFHNISDKWVPEIRQHCPKTPIILVGTQCDLRNDVKVLIELANYNEKPVTESEAKALFRKSGALTYIECSALTQKNLKEVFDTAILVAMDKRGLLGKKRHSKRSRKTSSPRESGSAQGHSQGEDSGRTKRGWRKLCCFL